MEKSPDDLAGMSASDAKEYIFHHIAALKLTEKRIEELGAELGKWTARIDLAHSRGDMELASSAEGEAEKIKARRAAVVDEAAEMKERINVMKKQLPCLAARERSVDPDLLEQELLMDNGYLPGDEEKAKTERAFKEIEKQSSTEAALEALKTKMGRNN